MMSDELLAIRGVSFAYPGGKAVFSDADFSLRSGDKTGIFGPNGSGKTTLLRLLAGLETPAVGAVFFRGEPVAGAEGWRRLRCSVGFVLQNSDDQLFSATVLDDVAFGPLNLGMKRDEAKKRALETLERLGIAGLASRPAHKLSGGEKKLAAIASVLSMRPDCLLLDEPTIFLDAAAQKRIEDILLGLGVPYAVVSHDTDFLRRVCDSFLRVDGSGEAVPVSPLSLSSLS